MLVEREIAEATPVVVGRLDVMALVEVAEATTVRVVLVTMVMVELVVLVTPTAELLDLPEQNGLPLIPGTGRLIQEQRRVPAPAAAVVDLRQRVEQQESHLVLSL
jgi:hypothetical protein